MSRKIRAYAAAFERRAMTPFGRRLGQLAAVSLLALAAAGCSAPPAVPVVGPDPSDPSAGRKAVSYRSTVAPYVSRRPVEPGPWREQNQQVAPPAKPQQ
jgi:hypothetical protein